MLNPFLLRARIVLLGLCFGLLLAGGASAAPLPRDQVPEPLRPWVGWALHGSENTLCPPDFNNGELRRCGWISRLGLSLGGKSGSWSQDVLRFNPGWLPIPGNALHWPQNVKLDGKAAVVTLRDEGPGVVVPAGTHTINGEFDWPQMPESLKVPEQLGLLSLTLDGVAVPNPKLEAGGLLWLRAGEGEAGESRVDLRVHRKIDDDIPLQVTTHLELSASGKNREITLPLVLLPGFTALSLQSPLPARLDPDGSLRVQVRPGRWELLVTGRSSGPLKDLSLPKTVAPLASEEVWSFVSRNALRLVSIEGVPSIDPQQSTLPNDWKSLPAYRVLPGETLRFIETRRGDPNPAPDQLALQRRLWLDFDGGGFTIQDRISGSISQSWRLEMDKAQALGHVAVNGADQYITRLTEVSNPGVEIRQGRADIVAESRLESRGALSATGWKHHFNSLSASVYLPPGWRLLHAAGADRAPSSWVERWSLFDFFLLLITTLATGKLFGWRWGAVAFGGLVLSWHEANAPHLAWLNLLALVALQRVLPAGRFARVLRGYWWLSIGTLVLVLLPFAVTQVRQTLYPVLERTGEIAGAGGGASFPSSLPPMAAAAPVPNTVEEAPVPMAEAHIAGDANVAAEPNAANAPQTLRDEVKRKMVDKPKRALSKQDYYEGSRSKSNANYQQQIQQQQNQMLDPNNKVQTGPGLPDWQWSDHRLIWSGPVEAGQSLHLWLLSPAANGVLTVLRLVVLFLLLAKLCNLDLSGLRRCCWPRRSGSTGSAAALLLGLCTALLLAPHSAQAADLPDSELLQQLQQKLTAPPDCLPQCAQISRLGVYATATSLQLRLEAHAETDTAIPLPGGVNQWLADQVLLDGKPAAGLMRDDAGTVWIALSRGVHEITLASGLAKRDVVQIALPLKPNRIEARLEQWSLEGLTADGRAGENLILSRSNPQAGTDAGGDGNLPPFVRVQRTFSLGLVWLVSTEVIRVGPGLAPVLVEIPLLKGESVTSGDVKVEQGKALINLGRTHSARFESTLQEAPQLELTASNAPNQIQHWRLDLGPQWHATLSGIPVVQHQDANARWLPEWRPWPGEKVTLTLSKPAGIAGQTLTLDQSRVQLSPGIRATDVSLHLVLRSSQAGQHSLTLPEGASLQSVRINGQLQPIRQEGRRVNLPISPGRQEISLAWRESTGMRTAFTSPAIDVGLRGVNSRLQLTIPPDRWTLLLSGPALGPAILFWGVVIVLAGIAAGLGRWRITPLRGRHWFLLGLGLAPVSWGLSALVMGWLLALGARRRWREAPTRRWLFNLTQIGLAAWTLLALLCLFWAVQQGLLGYPDMQITGNGSSTRSLNWFADRHGTMLPTAWVLSIPLWAYRVLMLLWASWLAYALLGWVKWAWESYCGGVGLWVRRPAKVKPNNLDTAPAAETAAVPLAGTSTPGADTVAGKDTPDSEG